MAALVGFTTVSATFSLTGALTLAQVIPLCAIPARSVVAGLDITTTDLDTAAVPLLTFQAGDGDDNDRYGAGITAGREAGTTELRPASSGWWRYNAADTVDLRVTAAPGTGATTGTITMVAYTYPAEDYGSLRKMVLQELGVLAAGEDARAEDAALVDAALVETHEWAKGRTARGTYTLANRQDLAWPLDYVPSFAARPYALLTGFRLSNVYGVTGAAVQLLQVRAADAERELARQCRYRTQGQPTEVEYY